MIKKILIALLLTIAVGYGMLKLLSNATYMNWGHHFIFENKLGIDLDSLEISVGDVKTIIQAASDSSGALEGNIYMPKEGYPHKVTFRVFSSENSMTLKADSFSCYNCDGSHQYTLKEPIAEYKFLN